MSDGRGEEEEEAATTVPPKNVTGKGGGGFDGRLSWRQFLGSADRLLQVSGAVDDNNSSSTTSTTSASAVFSSKWTSRKISEDEGGVYLVKVDYRYLDAQGASFSSPKGNGGDQPVLYKFEYNIFYSCSYQVPVLYFNICDQAGQAVSLEWLWRRLPRSLLTPSQQTESGAGGTSSSSSKSEEQLYALFGQMVTQAMHPITGSPTFTIHPCRTAQLMSPLVMAANSAVCCAHCQGRRQSVADNEVVVPSSTSTTTCTCNYLITWLSSLAPVAGLLLSNQYGTVMTTITTAQR